MSSRHDYVIDNQQKRKGQVSSNATRTVIMDINLARDNCNRNNDETVLRPIEDLPVGMHQSMCTSKRNGSRCTTQLPINHAANQRYVAGEQFFNYQQYGALRAGGDVSLWTKGNIGLVLVITQATMSVAVLKHILVPNLMSFLQISHTEHLASLGSLFLLPTGLSFPFGVLSDMFPLASFRRKSYMILGSIISCLVLFMLAALTATLYVEKLSLDERKSYVLYYTILILIASISSVMAMTAADARVIELSQQEPLTSRGTFAINYLSVRAVFTMAFTWSVSYMIKVENYNLVLIMSPAWFYTLLCGMALVPIPFLMIYSDENDICDVLSNSHCGYMFSLDELDVEIMGPAQTLSNTTRQDSRLFQTEFSLFRICQQRAVWQYVLFVIVLIATLHFSLTHVASALYFKAGFDLTLSISAEGCKTLVTFASLIIWRCWLTDVSWKRVVGAVIAFVLVHNILLTLIGMYYPIPGYQCILIYFYSVEGIIDAMLQVFLLIPVIEIAEHGSEGAMVGLVRSYQSIVESSVVALNLHALSDMANITPYTSESVVVRWAMMNYGVRALAFFALLLLPRQKLDAQQLRVYGGYSKAASIFVIAIFLVLFIYSSGSNGKALYDIVARSYVVA